MYSTSTLEKTDSRLRWIGLFFAIGFLILLGGLWFVQVVSFEKYERSREVQSSRTIRETPVRGKILDRHGVVLAENRPVYSVVLFMENLRSGFQSTYKRMRSRRSYSRSELPELQSLCRYLVASNIFTQVATVVRRPGVLDRERFERHYSQKPYVPFTLVSDLTEEERARFVGRGSHIPGVDLGCQSLRSYPQGNLAAHLLGYVRRSEPEDPKDGFRFHYHQPEYRGKKGIELIHDQELRGEPGIKSVLINNLMYRQEEHVWLYPVPGEDIYLTLDAGIQRNVEQALGRMRPAKRSAAVVMDVRNGNVLAMASLPAYDPNEFIGRLSPERWESLNDEEWRPLLNRVTNAKYPPGSIFKIVVALAMLEDGRFDPEESYLSLGHIQLGNRRIHDMAGSGRFDFRRAFAKSSNSYFIEHGLTVGIDSLKRWGDRFYLGRRTGLLPYQELAGNYPTWPQIREGWSKGETANLCIGQGRIAVTPLQMAVMMAAVANGGIVYRPRIVDRAQFSLAVSGSRERVFEENRVWGRLPVSRETIRTIHEAMLEDVEGMEGTGRRAQVAGLAIGGKTGTAQSGVFLDGREIKHTWFVSFAPVGNPRYAVVVLVEDGISGGISCAPVSQEIHRYLHRSSLASVPNR